jgi:uncharacterized membrane protein
LPGQWNAESTATSAFIVLFFAMFAAVSMKGFRRTVTGSAEVVVPVLVPLANAAWISLAMYSVLQDSGLHAALAWMMVALAALYLGLMRLQESAVATAVHLACAVVFLTIAIPLKASGHSLTTAWLVEGLALYWASTRVEGESGAPGRALSVLALGAYCLGLLSLSFHWFWMPVAYLGFFNANLGAAMIAAGSLAGLGWLASRSQEGEKPAILLTALVAINLVALLLVCGEISASSYYVQHAAFANVPFATSLVGLAILAGVAWVAYRLSETAGAACASVAGVTLVLFNLGAILSVEREIGALWSHSDAELARSLAISGFLMLYGAILLAAGFWKRSEFVRWQALILLIFTIGKVFFYDISGLSQGYRVASFLALGALLMGVSLAYQKDWLGLRATAAHPPKADE